MRDFKGMKRQRGRNRGGGGGGNSGGGGGGGKPQHNANRAFDSNGPDGVKIRGAAQHVYEKYQQLARDAGSAGDRVLAENYLQHAEHYFRTLRAMQPQRPVSEIVNRDQFVSGYDIDFEDENGGSEGGENDSEADGGEGEQPRAESRGDRQDRFEGQGQGQGRNFRDDRPRDDRPRDDRPREDRQRDDRPRDDYRSRDRDDRPRDDRPRDDRPRDDRARDDRPRDDRPRDDRPQQDRPRDDRPRDDRPRDDRPREDRFRDRDRNFRERDRNYRDDRRDRQEPRAERDPLGVVEPEATPLTQPRDAAPARDTVPPVAREPRAPREAPARMLRADDGDVSHAPAFLQARPAEAADETPAAEAKKPRRRRAPRSFEGGEGAPATADADEG